MLLEDILGLPVKAAVVVPGLLEIVLLLNTLLHLGPSHCSWVPSGGPHSGCSYRALGSIDRQQLVLGS